MTAPGFLRYTVQIMATSHSVRYGENDIEKSLLEWYEGLSGSENERDHDIILSESDCSSDSEIEAKNETSDVQVDAVSEYVESENIDDEDEENVEE